MGIKNFLSKTRVIDIQSCLPDGVLLITTEGSIQWFNSVATELFLIPNDSILNNSIDDFLENGLDSAITSSSNNSPKITRLIDSDEYIEITAKAIEGAYVVSMRNATQKYKAVNNMIEQHENNKKASNDKNSFFIKLSTDLRSPIHSVIGFSQAIIDGLGGTVTEKQAKYLKIINKNSTDLLYFFNKLVELSQTENDAFEKEIKYFDVVSTIKSVVKTNEQLYSDKNLDIILNIDEDTKKTIYTDGKAFKTMFQILLETLIRSTDIGTVQVNVASASDEFLTAHNMSDYSAVTISVSTSTNIILESEYEALFNPYAIADKSNKRTLVRSIALASVRNILNYLHGVIWVESAPLKGSMFNIILPLEKESNE